MSVIIGVLTAIILYGLFAGLYMSVVFVVYNLLSGEK